MADADDIAVADKDMRFAKRDALVDQLGRAGNDEERVAILFELRALMGVRRVLDRERMQVELLLHAMEEVGIGLEQSDPDDMTVLAGPCARLLDGYIGDAHAMRIDAGGDNAGLVGVALLGGHGGRGRGGWRRQGFGGKPFFGD